MKKNRKLKWLMLIISFLLVIIVLLMILFKEDVFKAIFKYGYREVYYGKNQKGNRMMDYAIRNIDHDNGEMYRSLSVQNTKNGNYNIAIDALEKAYSIAPKEVGGYYGWVLLYYYHDYQKSLHVLEQYDEFTPNFMDAPMGEDIHYLKGLAYMQLKQYHKAIIEFNTNIKNFEKVNQEDYLNIYVFVNNGRCLARIGEYEKAIIFFQKALKHYPHCAEAYYFMGLTQLQMNQNRNACNNFKKALDLVQKGYKSVDIYVELFHEVYSHQIENSITKYCYKS